MRFACTIVVTPRVESHQIASSLENDWTTTVAVASRPFRDRLDANHVFGNGADAFPALAAVFR